MPRTPNAEAKIIMEPDFPPGTLLADRVILEEIESGTPHVKYVAGIDEQHGLKVHTIDEESLQANPRRVAGTRTVTELDSFLAELTRRPLASPGTLWGNATRGELVAVYNDHNDEIAGWRDDQLVLKLQADADWAAWHELSGQWFTQADFGDLIEELIHTVVEPDQVDLLEIIDSVRASTKGAFQSEITRSNGGQKVTYNTEVEAQAGRTREIAVPQIIKLHLRPWDGHATSYNIEAYFRLRVDHGRLMLAVKLKPTRQIIREAWSDITGGVTAAIDKPVYARP
ncbi:hypothetical protein A5717_26175 [Mycolicibacterium porcinum]|uniref:DUF2303 family protein n=1 Tax=Mycolicibacterium porcinum TaxID=39693 RepID=UPI00080B47A9|nr:DUF2303 family protein [Mycolicibacterium porcinum]OCB09265.1 hypothetical protein A5717_26175 [Mycolicibacterium porcinum]